MVLCNNFEKENIMKKIVFGLALLCYASSVEAAGLYLSAGYGKKAPDFNAQLYTCASDSADALTGNCYGPGAVDLPGWPGGNVQVQINGQGYEASPWAEGLPERWDYNTGDGKTMGFAVGWDIPRNPFRFELEYQKMDFSADGYVMSIYDPQGTWCLSSAIDGDSCINTSRYDFDIDFYAPGMSGDVKSYFANVYFEIPGFGALDPYIGYGIGKSEVNFTVYDELSLPISGGSDGDVSSEQFIAGVEYRLSETPFILGVEYRQFKTDFNERDDGIYHELEHKYVMFKLRYDFISNSF